MIFTLLLKYKLNPHVLIRKKLEKIKDGIILSFFYLEGINLWKYENNKKILKIEFVKNRNNRIFSPQASEMLVLNGVKLLVVLKIKWKLNYVDFIVCGENTLSLKY